VDRATVDRLWAALSRAGLERTVRDRVRDLTAIRR
jgi:hypothetical protein